jgi:ABC-type transport system involved in multi-copper enzyme maturation permease subunit
MLKLVRAEMLKLRKSTGFGVLLLSSLLSGIFLGCFFLTDDMLSGGLDGFNQSMDAVQADIIFLSLFAAFFIANEFSNRTIGASIMGGHSRSKILLSKILVFFLGSIPILLAMPAFITAILTIVKGFGAPLTESVIMYLIRTFTVYILGGLALAACCALLAFIVRNAGGTIGAGIGILITLFYLTLFEPLSLVTRYTFMWQLSHITTFNMAESIFLPVCVTIITIVLTTLISAAVFKKTDLK